MKKIQYVAICIALFSMISCSSSSNEISSDAILAETYEVTDMVARGDGESDVALGDNTGSTTETLNAEAGTLTAGEWNDLNNWAFWQSLMQKESFFEFQKYWQFHPTQRYSVHVTDNAGQPVMDCSVSLLGKDKSVIWEAKTNHQGLAELWAQPFSEEKQLDNSVVITYNGTKHKIARPETVVTGVNEFKLPSTAALPQNVAEVMFVVDATGSMEDEIAYLKKELADVVNQVKTKQPDMTLNVGSLFYRDQGDEYVTRVSPLSADIAKTANFINQQAADGGGDYPEAVETALNEALGQQWSASARTRIIFLILDAPPHHDNAALQALQAQIKKASEKGVKLIPIASSGIDKDTEFLMRFMAMCTNGSYVFITDHSGVGNGHVEPTVGEYRVEYLNDLMARIINESTKPTAVTVQ